MKIAPRPEFYRLLDHKTGTLMIGVRWPRAFDEAKIVDEDFGDVMYCICYEALSGSDEGKDTLQKIRAGNFSFLFKGKRGEFVKRQNDAIKADPPKDPAS
jgi:hypothetical protein